jgi:hypothetical protein
MDKHCLGELEHYLKEDRRVHKISIRGTYYKSGIVAGPILTLII